ncbi:hypothetical protein EW145_g3660 [Phellinidium pouzarii]|uniref:Uncharacterized protein n=1 Tax=Phellinidium pouzarii TaxID=167371 RepID=A0A4S4L6B8_9AGAM|nr:hypothetical protein EW145_g3660 [Phellinidium pouzarii]
MMEILGAGTEAFSETLSKGTIAAVVIIPVVAVGAIALWIFFAYRSRRRREALRSLNYPVGDPRNLTGAGPSSGVRSLRPGLAALGRERSNSSAQPMRTSPLEDEDAVWDMQAPHSVSEHSGGAGGMMREAGSGVLPGWLPYTPQSIISGEHVQRVRDADGGRDDGELAAGGGIMGRDVGLLEAAGLLGAVKFAPSPANADAGLSMDPTSALHNRRTSASIPPYNTSFYLPSARPESPSSQLHTEPSNIPTRGAGFEGPDSDDDGSRSRPIMRSASGSMYVRRDPPPSAWTAGEKGREKVEKGKGKERTLGGDAASIVAPASVAIAANDTDTFGGVRSRSSMDFSSSGHGHGYGSRAVTSSQGHGSATASGENSSASGSSSSHVRGSAVQRIQSKSSNEESSFLARAASLTRLRLRARLRRSSATQVVSPNPVPAAEIDGKVFDVVPPASTLGGISLRPLSHAFSAQRPLSTRIIPSATPAFAMQPPSPVSASAHSMTTSRPPSSLLRPHSPGPIANFPPVMHVPSGGRLSVIPATPSPLPTPDAGTSDGLLDPRLTMRLQEIHGGQASRSTVGLRDHEDYSRPIGGLVNNPRDSSTTVSSRSSHYSQQSRDSGSAKTPTMA